jgi:hypothetical protein
MKEESGGGKKSQAEERRVMRTPLKIRSKLPKREPSFPGSSKDRRFVVVILECREQFWALRTTQSRKCLTYYCVNRTTK